MCALKFSQVEIKNNHFLFFRFLPFKYSAMSSKSHLLSEQQVKQYFEDGFLILNDFFKPEELQPAMESINGRIRNFCSNNNLLQNPLLSIIASLSCRFYYHFE